MCAVSASALNSGTDVFIPAAARGAGSNDSFWMLDAYAFNPGTESATVLVYWLERWAENSVPASAPFVIGPGETLVLQDVINTTFGLEFAQGALRVVSSHPIVVTARSYNLKDGVTFGQGWEGVPHSIALGPGDSTDIVGLVHNAQFRTNIMLVDTAGTGEGTIVNLSLRNVNDQELASGTYTLKLYEPVLYPITDLGVQTFDNATLYVEVTQGSAIAVAAKVDNDLLTGDPTTLETWMPVGAGSSPDGVYQVALYDSADYATGGRAEFLNRELTQINATYSNFDKETGGEADCPWAFRLQMTFSPSVSLAQLETGTDFTIDYPGSGEITYSLSLTLDQNFGFVGTVGAVGSDFSGEEAGCNGTFPDQDLIGGKSGS